ncbi:hypothetical protein [Alteromonas sp. ALT199]|uniref:hypothetical protein n=1 Tax=unclassified Alteromonas TaxID=2614992 RepID=UPI0004523242|nr:hypothetical protein [Alteromonas sp. ALT199]
MKNLTRRTIFHFIPSWAVGFLLASVFHSTAVLMGLVDINVELTVNDWLFMMWQDALGLLPTYGVIIAVTLLLAFSVTHFIVNRLSLHKTKVSINQIRFVLFTVAGGLSFLLMLLAMQPMLNVTLIAGARSTLGLIAQCLAGVLAGGMYSQLSDSSGRH